MKLIKIWVALFTWVSLINTAVAEDYLIDPLDDYRLPSSYFDEEELVTDSPNLATIQETIIQPGFSVYSWNVGGGGGVTSTLVRNQIIAMNPDILLLCEVGTQERVNNLVTYLNAQLNTTYYAYYQEAGSTTYPLAFLSKYSYQSTQTFVNSKMQKALLKVVIKINNEDYTFYGLHAVTARNKTFHENEAKQFLTAIQPGLRTIVLGDFNSRSRLDGAVHSLSDSTYSSQGWAYPNTVSNDLFTAAGWVDTWRHQYPNIAVTATKLTKRGTTNKGSNLGERIDYIWVSPDLTSSILAVGINTETTNYLSDHKPVWARIDAGGQITTLGGRDLDNTPTIASSSLAANNRYLDITFTEGVYRDINASQPLTVDNFEISFDPHATGNASGVTINSVKQPDNEDEVMASPLVGGEVTVRLFLNVDGVPNGNETIKVHLAGENASAQDNMNKLPAHIYNSAGIADHWTYVDVNQVGIASCIRTNYHHLKVKSLSVTFMAQLGGTINGNSQVQQDVTHGTSSIPVTAIPEDGYYFVNWTKAGQEYSTEPTLVVDSVTEDVVFTAHFAPSVAPNLLLDGDFTLAPNLKSAVYHTEVNQGWYQAKISRWSWDVDDQWVYVNRADKSAGISQVISDTGIQGTLNIEFWGLNQATDTITNTLQLQVFGINGQFKLSNWNTAKPQPYNQDPTFSYTLLFNKKFTYQEDFTWIPFQASFPVAHEYQYLVLRFVVKGVNPLIEEILAIDRVKLSTQSVTPTVMIINEDFSEPINWSGNGISPGQVNSGWYVAKNSRWTWDNTNNWVSVKKERGGGGLTQVLSATDFKGTVNFNLRLLNQEVDKRPNRLQIQVFGINGPFKLSYWQTTPPQSDNDSTLVYQLLLDDTLGNGQSFDWNALSTQFEVTQDYEYFAIRIFVTGVEPSVGDVLALDDVKIN
jgi:exonuclease III